MAATDKFCQCLQFLRGSIAWTVDNNRRPNIELASLLTGNDPDDLLHLAAAMEAGCDVVLTNNTRDSRRPLFPSASLSHPYVRRINSSAD
jgi:hypothetical protein